MLMKQWENWQIWIEKFCKLVSKENFNLKPYKSQCHQEISLQRQIVTILPEVKKCATINSNEGHF